MSSTVMVHEPTDQGTEPIHVPIAIIGSGFAGMGLAIKLRERGRSDFLVFERSTDVGGTWRDNSYPGCQCDVPSNLYSFSFAPNPDWSHTYPVQPEIYAYLQRCADRFGIRPFIRFQHALTDARWDEAANEWVLATTQGNYTADLLVMGCGPLSEPSIPDIAGASTFAGSMFHTARWDHGHDLTGERVAIIGTGASAIQVIPKIQPEVEHLTVFQRTPPWVLPHPDREVPAWKRRLYRRVPLTQKFDRLCTYIAREAFLLGFVVKPELMRKAEEQATAHMESAVADPDLRRKLRPTFSLGCKRVLLSDTYYPALASPNVEVVTDGVARITPDGVVDADGTEHRVDTIVWGTGFHVTDFPVAQVVRNAEGRTLLEEVTDGDGMYLGCTAPTFPNLFMMVGPNTGLGNTSILFMIESQLNYILDALTHLDRSGSNRVELRPEVARAYNEEMQEKLDGTVWNSGCKSWYLDERGRNLTLWPTFTWPFRRRTRHFDTESYTLTRAPARTVSV